MTKGVLAPRGSMEQLKVSLKKLTNEILPAHLSLFCPKIDIASFLLTWLSVELIFILF